MVKIKYVGDMKNCRVKVLNSIFNNLNNGDILTLSTKEAEHILKNNNFVKVGDEKKNITSYKPIEKEIIEDDIGEK